MNAAKAHLIFDMYSIAYKYFHAIYGKIAKDEHEKIGGMINFRFMFECIRLQELFSCRNLYFVFDHKSLRAKHYPNYKKKRITKKQSRTKEEKLLYRKFEENMQTLRKTILRKELGFRNVYRKKDYEADDIIAFLVKFYIPKTDQKIIVTGDFDLHQLIDENCMVYDTKNNLLITKKSFKKKWGISPKDLPLAKALMGDSSDSIKGVKGIGIKRAIDYINGNLKLKHCEFIKTVKKLVESNLDLIRLPYKYLKGGLTIKKDRTAFDKWQKFCQKNPLCGKLQNSFLKGNNNG